MMCELWCDDYVAYDYITQALGWFHQQHLPLLQRAHHGYKTNIFTKIAFGMMMNANSPNIEKVSIVIQKYRIQTFGPYPKFDCSSWWRLQRAKTEKRKIEIFTKQI